MKTTLKVVVVVDVMHNTAKELKEAAHTEALDALEKLCAAQKHVLEVRCAGDDEYMAACDGAESILAKAGRR